MGNVRRKVDVPISIIKEAFKFALSWIVLFIAPSKTPVLKVGLLELSSIEGVSEPGEAATVHIGMVFVSSTVYLIEVPINQPSCT